MEFWRDITNLVIEMDLYSSLAVSVTWCRNQFLDSLTSCLYTLMKWCCGRIWNFILRVASRVMKCHAAYDPFSVPDAALNQNCMWAQLFSQKGHHDLIYFVISAFHHGLCIRLQHCNCLCLCVFYCMFTSQFDEMVCPEMNACLVSLAIQLMMHATLYSGRKYGFDFCAICSLVMRLQFSCDHGLQCILELWSYSQWCDNGEMHESFRH